MSARDKLRSFADSRSADHELIRDGLTYEDARDLLHRNARLAGQVITIPTAETALVYRWKRDDETLADFVRRAIHALADEEEQLAARGDRDDGNAE